MTNTIMQTKEVAFQDAILLAVQDNSNQIWVGVSHVCNGIGFNKSQKDRQIKNVQSDIVLNRGCVKFDAGVFDPNNATVAILIDFLPLWLAKISITPTMKKNNPTLVEKLITYQLKAKDVLASAFLPQTTEIKPTPQNCTILNRTIQTLQQTQQELAQSSIEYGYILHDHEIRLDQHEEYITDLNQFKEEIKAEVKQIELLTQDSQELKAVNLIPRLSIQDVVKLDYKEFASKVHSLVIELASKRKEVAGNTYNYLYSLIYSNRGNWTDMVEAIKKQGMLGFNIENSKLIYDHLPLRKTYVKTLLAALYN